MVSWTVSCNIWLWGHKRGRSVNYCSTAYQPFFCPYPASLHNSRLNTLSTMTVSSPRVCGSSFAGPAPRFEPFFALLFFPMVLKDNTIWIPCQLLLASAMPDKPLQETLAKLVMEVLVLSKDNISTWKYNASLNTSTKEGGNS